MRFNVGDKVELIPFDEAKKVVDKDIRVTRHYIHGISKVEYEENVGKVFTISQQGMYSCVLAEDPFGYFWPMECLKEATPQPASEKDEDEEEKEKQFETPVECMTWLIGEFDEITDMIDPTDTSETYHKVRAALVRIMEEFEEEK